MSQYLSDRTSRAEIPAEDETRARLTANEADLGELRSSASARTRLLLELFPRDAGPSVLPSAESPLVLSESSDLTTYLDALLEAVRGAKEPASDPSASPDSGSEQPLPS